MPAPSRSWTLWPAFICLTAGMAHGGQGEEPRSIHESATVGAEVMTAPDSAIPQSVLHKAEALVVLPSVLKAGFIFGGHHGRGLISARDRRHGRWSPPAFLSLTGGSFGALIGGESVDIVLVEWLEALGRFAR